MLYIFPAFLSVYLFAVLAFLSRQRWTGFLFAVCLLVGLILVLEIFDLSVVDVKANFQTAETSLKLEDKVMHLFYAFLRTALEEVVRIVSLVWIFVKFGRTTVESVALKSGALIATFESIFFSLPFVIFSYLSLIYAGRNVTFEQNTAFWSGLASEPSPLFMVGLVLFSRAATHMLLGYVGIYAWRIGKISIIGAGVLVHVVHNLSITGFGLWNNDISLRIYLGFGVQITAVLILLSLLRSLRETERQATFENS